MLVAVQYCSRLRCVVSFIARFEKLKEYKVRRAKFNWSFVSLPSTPYPCPSTQDDHGSCHVSRTVNDSDLKPLARWVKTQRALYKSGKILKDRKEKLESLQFVWDGTQLPIKRKRRRQSEEGATLDDNEPPAKQAKEDETQVMAGSPGENYMAAPVPQGMQQTFDMAAAPLIIAGTDSESKPPASENAAGNESEDGPIGDAFEHGNAVIAAMYDELVKDGNVPSMPVHVDGELLHTASIAAAARPDAPIPLENETETADTVAGNEELSKKSPGDAPDPVTQPESTSQVEPRSSLSATEETGASETGGFQKHEMEESRLEYTLV